MYEAIESNKQRLFIFLFDRIIIGLLLLGVALLVQNRWHADDINLETERYQHQLAAQLIPQVSRSELDPNNRSFMLATLVNAKAISAPTAAGLGEMLVEQDVSGSHLAQALNMAMMADIGPFIDVTQPVVKSVRLGKIIRDPMPNALSRLSTWNVAFQAYAILDHDPKIATTSMLNNPSFLANTNYGVFETGRLHTLAYLLTPQATLDFSSRYFQAVKRLAQSEVFALTYIGNAAWLAHTSENLCMDIENCDHCSAHRYIYDRINRPGDSSLDAQLLAEEIRILSDSKAVFGRKLAGDIALPLAQQYLNSEHNHIRSRSYAALRSMKQHGIQAERFLSAWVDQLTIEFREEYDRYRLSSQAQRIAEIALLAGDMQSTQLMNSLDELFDLEHVSRNNSHSAEMIKQFQPSLGRSMQVDGYGCGLVPQGT